MMEFTKRDISTNAIIAVGYCPDDDISFQAQTGEGTIVGYYPPSLYYIEGLVPVAKLPYSLSVSKYTITADGVDQSIITNIPVSTIILIGRYSSFNVDDGVFEITSNEVATLELVFVNRQYLTSTVTINAI